MASTHIYDQHIHRTNYHPKSCLYTIKLKKKSEQKANQKRCHSIAYELIPNTSTNTESL